MNLILWLIMQNREPNQPKISKKRRNKNNETMYKKLKKLLKYIIYDLSTMYLVCDITYVYIS